MSLFIKKVPVQQSSGRILLICHIIWDHLLTFKPRARQMQLQFKIYLEAGIGHQREKVGMGRKIVIINEKRQIRSDGVLGKQLSESAEVCKW